MKTLTKSNGRIIRGAIVSIFILSLFVLYSPMCTRAAGNQVLEQAVTEGGAILYISGINEEETGDFNEIDKAFQVGQIEGKVKSVNKVGSTQAPINTIILWDNSLSVMKKNGELVREILQGIVGHRNDGESFQIALVTDRTPEILSDLTSDVASLEKIIQETDTENKDAYLIDNIYSTIESLANSDTTEFTRIILIADVDDYNPSLGRNLTELDALVAESPYPIYAVCKSKGAAQDRIEGVGSLARRTGGAFYSIDGDEAVDVNEIYSGLSNLKGIVKVETTVPQDIRDGSLKDFQLTLGQKVITGQVRLPFSIKADEPTPKEPEPEPAPVVIEEEKPDPKWYEIFPWKLTCIAVAAMGIIAAVVIIIVTSTKKKKAKKKAEEAEKAAKMQRLNSDLQNRLAAPAAPPVQRPRMPRSNGEVTAQFMNGAPQSQPSSSVERTEILSAPQKPAAGRKATITLRDEANPARVFTASFVQPFIIGRGAGNSIVISDDKSVSGKHCEIGYMESAYFIRDLGSSNKTFLNGEQLTVPRSLAAVNKVKIGRGSYTLTIEE